MASGWALQYIAGMWSLVSRCKEPCGATAVVHGSYLGRCFARRAPMLLLLVGCAAGGGSEEPPPEGDGAPSDRFGAGGASGNLGPDFGEGIGRSQGCNQLQIGFEPRTPTALVVVDRSSSQWDGYPNHTWEPVKNGLLEVIERVQGDMRIGIVTYTGQNGGTCPEMIPPVNQISFSENNYESIRAALESVDQPNYKGETPTAAAITASIPVLLADPSPGEKFILLVTDGDPDFCDDPNPVCPMDAVVGAVQRAYTEGVSTTVFGLRRNGVALSEQHLRDVANAGSGLPVALPREVNGRIEDLQNRCNAPVVGSYSQEAGQAEYYQANGDDLAGLEDALNAIILGIRSCVFDLGGSVEVDLERASLATVQIDQDAPLAYDSPDGWRMLTETQLELTGSACQRLKQSGTRNVFFDFPCDIFVPR